MQTFIQAGDNMTVVAPATVASGDGVLVGAMFGAATTAAASGAAVVLRVTGVVQLAKATGQAWTQGVAVFWDNTAKNVTTTVGSNVRIGVAAEAALTAATVGIVRLNGSF